MQKHKDFQRFLKVSRDPLECVWNASINLEIDGKGDCGPPDMGPRDVKETARTGSGQMRQGETQASFGICSHHTW